MTIMFTLLFIFAVEVSLSAPPPVFEGGAFAIQAFSPIINLTITTTITSITFTINGRPISEITGLTTDPVVVNMNVVNLIIRNIPASLNGKIVSCTAELSTGDMASCAPRTLQVQGNSLHNYVISIWVCQKGADIPKKTFLFSSVYHFSQQALD